MNRDIVLNMVDNLDKNSIIFPSIESGTWKPSIDCDNRFGGTQPGGVSHNHLHILTNKQTMPILSSLGSCQLLIEDENL